MKERLFSKREFRDIAVTIKIANILICKLHMVKLGWIMLNKLAIRHGFKHWPDMSNYFGW